MTVAAPPRGCHSRIVGTGSYLPTRVLSNAELEKLVDTNHEWIVTRTGISERRIAADGEATSDLALLASERALRMAGIKARDLDLVIVATLTPDMLIPSTAAILQNALGAKRAGAMDLEAACSGFVYGVAVADAFIRSGGIRTALVVGAEVLSRWINWEDRTTCVIFGDGAGAAVLTADERPGILSCHLGADGSKGHLLCIPGGGSRLPVTAEVLEQRRNFIAMVGNETFKIAVKAMTDAIEMALTTNGLGSGDVDLLVPHQANIRIIEATSAKSGIPMERVMVNIDRYGNTSSATIPIALDEANREGRIKDGSLVLLDAFGAGFTWGSVLMRW
jgi:3-oxoacyl-[acyl-carrier-protein] synthase-3